jgi:hypothetical protein
MSLREFSFKVWKNKCAAKGNEFDLVRPHFSRNDVESLCCSKMQAAPALVRYGALALRVTSQPARNVPSFLTRCVLTTSTRERECEGELRNIFAADWGCR